VGKPNLHEFSITLILSGCFPDYLPKIIASDPLLNGWLMESGGEATLRDVDDLNIWREGAQRLAQLQIESIPRDAELLQAGCRDLRTEALANSVAPFFETMAGLMEQQTKSSPPPLSRRELSDVASIIEAALHLSAKIGIPDTLGHSDFNPGNILVNSERCVFADWAEAHVGHPFMTFEYLRAHLRKSFPDPVTQEEDLREAYSQSWLSATSLTNIGRALEFSPIIAVYAHAISSNAWRDSERLAMPNAPGYLRGLTRRMKQEADLLRLRRHV